MSLTETQDFSRALIQGAPLAAAGFRARRPCEFIVVLNALDADAIAAGAQTGESESAVSKSTLAPGSSRPVFERVNWGAKSTKSRYLRLSTGGLFDSLTVDCARVSGLGGDQSVGLVLKTVICCCT